MEAAEATGKAPVQATLRGPVDAVVEVDRLTKTYGRVQALHDVSFMVPAGAVTGFLCPNGSGKTTALRTPLGLVAPSSGTALIHGRRRGCEHGVLAVLGLAEAVLDPLRFHGPTTGALGILLWPTWETEVSSLVATVAWAAVLTVAAGASLGRDLPS